jgi:hypothetical protein
MQQSQILVVDLDSQEPTRGMITKSIKSTNNTTNDGTVLLHTQTQEEINNWIIVH